LNRLSDEELEYLEGEDPVCIALSLKQNYNKKDLKEEDFYNIGVLFRIDEIEKKETGYQIQIEILERIEIKAMNISHDFITAEYEEAADIIDLDEAGKEEMMGFLKKVIDETGAYFKGSEQFMKLIDKIDKLNVLMGYISQYMRLN
jgi:ATP-dependent Lon protease